MSEKVFNMLKYVDEGLFERTFLAAWGMWALQWLLRKDRIGHVLTE